MVRGNLSLEEVDDEALAIISPQLTPEVRAVLTAEGSVAARNGIAGTAPARVAAQREALAARIALLATQIG